MLEQDTTNADYRQSKLPALMLAFFTAAVAWEVASS